MFFPTCFDFSILFPIYFVVDLFFFIQLNLRYRFNLVHWGFNFNDCFISKSFVWWFLKVHLYIILHSLSIVISRRCLMNPVYKTFGAPKSCLAHCEPVSFHSHVVDPHLLRNLWWFPTSPGYVFSGDRVSRCSPGYPGTFCVDKEGLEVLLIPLHLSPSAMITAMHHPYVWLQNNFSFCRENLHPFLPCISQSLQIWDYFN